MAVTKALAKLASTVSKGSGNVIAIINAAAGVAAAAAVLAQQAKPLVDQIDVQGAAQGVVGAGKGAIDKAAGFFGKIGDTKDEFIAGLAQAKSAKELKKDILEARQTVLENATTFISVVDMLKAQEKAEGVGTGPIQNMPGCFLIATYKKRNVGKNLTDYVGLYIGRDENAAAGVAKAISREGDPDVYADVKYRQNVHAYVYYCLPENLDEYYESLSQAFEETVV